MHESLKKKIPTILSFARLLLSPVLIYLGLYSSRTSFILFFFILELTELIDGPLARKWKVSSDKGRKLDTIADYTFLGIFLITTVIIIRDEIVNYLNLIILIFGILLTSYIVSKLFNLAYAKKLCTFHLTSSRISQYFFVAWMVLSLLGIFSIPLLLAFAILGQIGVLEDILIVIKSKEKVDENITSFLKA
ncbi:CDP-alcohol phosphatidyltransferase family protein [Candidatus Dojkabacteria bacterium]|nr:CDP-alcohol phosphatidyltransferase family protein [Candidatus Dojkabacteria bacterium]